MLVSHLKQFIYTKTSKTAGTSVEVYFEPYCMHENEWAFSHGRDVYESDAGIIGCRGASREGKTWYNHMPASLIRDGIGREKWDSYFKFCTIRNPFDKIISGFHFEVPQFKNPEADKALMKAVFRQWILSGKMVDDRDRYIIDNDICMNYFIRYESLQEGIKHVCDQLGIPYEPERLPKLKAQFRPNGFGYNQYYDVDTLALVARYYQFEIQKFGFSVPDIASGQARYAEPANL